MTTMIMLPKTFLVLGIGLVMLPGCPLLNIEADVQEVCLTYPGLQVVIPDATPSITQSFVFDDLSAVHDLAKQHADLAFVRAELRVNAGLDSFGGVRHVQVDLSSGDPESGLPTLTMYECHDDCMLDGNVLELPASVGGNAIDYLRSDAIAIDLDFKGEIPAGSWTMDIDVCMKAKASYTLSP